METTGTLEAEHAGVLVVLDQLERAVSAAERGAPVPLGVFTDIGEFFSVFVDRCHHGKEETVLFPRLSASGAAAIARRLEAEHQTGRRLAGDYAAAVRAYTPGDAVAGRRIARAARAYADFLRAHIDLESRELLPTVESTLAADDRELTVEFERIEEERIGPGTHERLHHMIEGLAERIDPYTPAGALPR